MSAMPVVAVGGAGIRPWLWNSRRRDRTPRAGIALRPCFLKPGLLCFPTTDRKVRPLAPRRPYPRGPITSQLRRSVLVKQVGALALAGCLTPGAASSEPARERVEAGTLRLPYLRDPLG